MEPGLKPGFFIKPKYAEVLIHSNSSPCAEGASEKPGRIYYPDWDATPAMGRQDPWYVDYATNTIGIHSDGNCLFRAVAFAV